MDAKPRELYLLFRAYSGYESSLLKVTDKNGNPSAPVGFVTFVTHQDANEARRKVQGIRFDPELSQTIRLELANSNTKVSKPQQPSPPAFSPGIPETVVTPNSAAGFLLNSHGAQDQTNSRAAAAASTFVSSPKSVDREPFKILQPPEKRTRIDTPSCNSSALPSLNSGSGVMSLTNGENDISSNGQSDNSSKIVSAHSIESLDNCSTVSSGDPLSQVSIGAKIIILVR